MHYAITVSNSDWIVDGELVREMTSEEKTERDAAAASAAAAAAAAALAALKQQALDYYTADQDALQRALKAAIETVVELTVDQLNTLRALHGLADLTDAQVKNAFQVAYQAKIDAITS